MKCHNSKLKPDFDNTVVNNILKERCQITDTKVRLNVNDHLTPTNSELLTTR